MKEKNLELLTPWSSTCFVQTAAGTGEAQNNSNDNYCKNSNSNGNNGSKTAREIRIGKSHSLTKPAQTHRSTSNLSVLTGLRNNCAKQCWRRSGLPRQGKLNHPWQGVFGPSHFSLTLTVVVLVNTQVQSMPTMKHPSFHGDSKFFPHSLKPPSPKLKDNLSTEQILGICKQVF